MKATHQEISEDESNIAAKIIAETWDDLESLSIDDMISQIDNLVAVFEGEQSLQEFKLFTPNLSTGQMWLN